MTLDQAYTSPPLRYVGEGRPISLDDRFLVIVSAANGRILVFDGHTGRRFGVTPPRQCSRPQNASGGHVVFLCQPFRGLEARPLLYDLTRRVFRRAVPPRVPPGVSSPNYWGGGRYWLRISGSRGHDISVDEYHNWRTGEVRPDVEAQRAFADVNWPTLSRPLCAGVRRARWGTADEWLDFVVYKPPYVLLTGSEKVLDRCGVFRRRRVSGGADLGRNLLVESFHELRLQARASGFDVAAQRLPAGRKTLWRVSPHFGGCVHARALGARVVIAVSGGGCEYAARVYVTSPR